MMYVIAVQKLFSFGIICNILIVIFVLSCNAEKIKPPPTTNSPIYLNSKKSDNVDNQLKGNHNSNQNGVPVSTGPTTDSEVSDLIKNTHHLQSTLRVTAVTETTKDNIKTDDFTDVSIDKISEAESKVKANGRFNPTSGAIAAVTCLSLAVVAYIGIVLWRNVIQRNYENREILLNEDDIGDINDEDMRHFELKLMDKDGKVIEPSRG